MGALLSKPQDRIRIATKKVKETESDVYTRKTMLYLYLCKDNIIEIDRNIQLLNNLRVLQICCNKITALPREIGRLKNLSILFLSRNCLLEIPDEISSLDNLNDMNLSDNNLSALPESLQHLKSLKILDISGNPFTVFPKVVSKLRSLSCLSVLRTKIEYLSPSLLHLSFLVELNYKSKERKNMIVKNSEINLLDMVSEHTIRSTKYIKKMLPIGTLRRIAEYKECDVCSKYIYNPVLIYTSLTIADNTVPIKYNLCSDHEIDISNPYNSIRKSLFIEERHLDRSEEAEESRELIDILQVDKLIEKYNRKLYNNLRE